MATEDQLSEQAQFEALLAEAQRKLREAETAWYAAFAAAPLGDQRIMANTV